MADSGRKGRPKRRIEDSDDDVPFLELSRHTHDIDNAPLLPDLILQPDSTAAKLRAMVATYTIIYHVVL
jgi:hypothetical protein